MASPAAPRIHSWLEPRARVARVAMLTLVLTLALALGTGLAGCTADPQALAPLPAFGVVTGQVLEAGRPVAARLTFRSQSDVPNNVSLEVTADSTGWYRVELPLGSYRYGARIDNWTWLGSSAEDTIRVGRSERRLDLRRGRARVTVRLPAGFDGSEAALSLRSVDFAADGRADVVADSVVLDLRLLKPDTYLMKFSPDWDHEDVYLPGVFTRFEADSLRVGLDAVSTYAGDFTGSAVTVSGRISGSWQQSHWDMTVWAHDQWGRHVAQARCAEDGSYTLRVLAPGQFRFSSACRNIEHWFGGDGYATATPYDLGPGAELAGLDFSEGGLKVRFVGPGLILDNRAVLDVVRDDGTRWLQVGGEGNPALIPNLAPGNYRLFVHGTCRLRPWQAQWYDRALDEAAATAVSVAAGAFTDVTINLEAGGVLSGTLTGRSAASDYWPAVRLHDGEGTALCGSFYPSEDGKFDIPGLPDGDYCLSLYGDTTWWYPGTADLAEAARLTISGGQALRGLTWPLPPGSKEGSR